MRGSLSDIPWLKNNVATKLSIDDSDITNSNRDRRINLVQSHGQSEPFSESENMFDGGLANFSNGVYQTSKPLSPMTPTALKAEVVRMAALTMTSATSPRSISPISWVTSMPQTPTTMSTTMDSIQDATVVHAAHALNLTDNTPLLKSEKAAGGDTPPPTPISASLTTSQASMSSLAGIPCSTELVTNLTDSAPLLPLTKTASDVPLPTPMQVSPRSFLVSTASLPSVIDSRLATERSLISTDNLKDLPKPPITTAPSSTPPRWSPQNPHSNFKLLVSDICLNSRASTSSDMHSHSAVVKPNMSRATSSTALSSMLAEKTRMRFDVCRPHEPDPLRPYKQDDGGGAGEMKLVVGDIITVACIFNDGWALGKNLTTSETGYFPLSCSDSD